MRFFGKDHRVYGWLRSKVCVCRHTQQSRDKGHAALLRGMANFPQLWVDGELVGGCDIVTEMFESGELEALLSETTERHTDSEDS